MNRDSVLLTLAQRYQRAPAKLLNLEKLCFPEQLAFIKDPSPFITGVTSRRAGKTTSCALDLLGTALEHPGVVCLYITLSRINASQIIWPTLKQFNKDLGLNGLVNETQLALKLPNGSIIFCSGAKDQREIDKFLGRKFKLVYIDETQSFRSYIIDLIDRVLAPALMDYAGKLKVIGTPGALPVGPFWDLANSKEWSHHHWTFWNNPHLPLMSGMTHQQLLDRELKRKGVTTDDPTIQREWFGKWKYDYDALVYKYQVALNDYDSLPDSLNNFVLGIDVGFHDSDALAVLGWNDVDPVTFLVEELITAKQGITELVEQIEILRNKYEITKIVMDTGGLGKKISEEIIRRYQIPVMPAEKVRKFENIELMNDALRTKKFKAKKASRFAQDCMLLEWDMDKSTPERKVVSDKYHSDACDAVLYAWRESYSFTSKPEPTVPKWGTHAWAQAEAQRMEEEAEEHFKRLEEDNGFF